MQRGQNPSPASTGNRPHSVESSARHSRDVSHAQAAFHFDSHGQKPAQVQSKLIERSFAFANPYNAGPVLQALALQADDRIGKTEKKWLPATRSAMRLSNSLTSFILKR